MGDADRTVEFDILARNRSGPAVRDAAQGFEKLGDKSDEAKRQLTQLERETSELSRKMLETKAAAALLAREFGKTGDAKTFAQFRKLTVESNRLAAALKAIKPPKIDLPPKIKPPKIDLPKVNVDLFGRNVDNTVFRKLFGSLVDEAQKAGKLAGDVAIDSLGAAFKALPAEVKLALGAGLVAAAIAAAPLIVTVVDAAVLAGVGAGGLAAGIALAAQDPAVSAAFTVLGDNILQDLKTAAIDPFRDELLDAAGDLGAAFDGQVPRIQRIFSQLSTLVAPLTAGLAGAVDELGPGLEAAVASSLPLLRQLAQELPRLGAAVGSLLGSIAQAGPGAELVFRVILDTVVGLIRVFDLGVQSAAPLLNALAAFGELTGVYHSASSAGGDLARSAGQVTGELTRQDVAVGSLTQDYSTLGQSLTNTANAADALNATFSRLFGEMMSLDQANLAIKQGWLDLRDAVQENGTSLDDNTRKGQANIQMIQQQVSNLAQQRDAAIAAGDGTVESAQRANAAYGSNVAQLRGLLLQLGFTAVQVDNLIGKYNELAIPRTTTFTTIFKNIGTPAEKMASGHSHDITNTDTSALASWAPAQFAERQRLALAATGGGTSRTGGPVQVSSTVEQTLTVLLDGQPFRTMVDRAVSGSERRQAWRAKVGRR